jgi:6-phosphofructokinase 1
VATGPSRKILGILVGGGPAPGINSVIRAATIRARLLNTKVLGILDGFKWLMREGNPKVRPLDIEDVSRIHFEGGSILGTARDNPTRDPKHLETVIKNLKHLHIGYLISIGGDDTLYSAHQIQQACQGEIQLVHVPKTIDNDLELPHGMSTFGFQTARHLGVEIVENLMRDALTTHRWYFVVAMGRSAGHLALGIGKSSGATLTVIPEEFRGRAPTLKEITDILAGAILKRLAEGRPDGVAVLAEGLAESIGTQGFKGLTEVEKDAHGHIRLSEIDLGTILKKSVQHRLSAFNVPSTLVPKNIGYELRCADPTPFDIAYTQDLGFLACNHLLKDKASGNLVCIVNMKFTPIPFQQLIHTDTGRTRVRMVNIDSDTYRISYAYMLRLKRFDFENPEMLGKLAAVTGLSTMGFKKEFEYLMNRPVHQNIDIETQIIDL